MSSLGKTGFSRLVLANNRKNTTEDGKIAQEKQP